MTTPILADRIVQLVSEGVTTIGALKKAMPGTPSQSIYAVLHHLVREGRLVRVALCSYVIGAGKPPGQPDEPADEPAETIEANDEPVAADAAWCGRFAGGADLIAAAPTMHAALRSCLLLAAKHRREEWAQHVMRFCADAGVRPQVLRGDGND